ncbi:MULTISPECIES: anthranilate synthase component I family protein [Bacillaceae]|uniref:Anthranilate synthase component I family protein n=1 Tax=Evansella alkalicola TaxID=745819 RepID=A0ABS6JTV9_9BACI|nr:MULTISPECIES: anthranilate synthase component I family protein [Bacillaceae]MBU9722019.1 anthranilate synthase component I family protein [Bacillus alkalicola]
MTKVAIGYQKPLKDITTNWFKTYTHLAKDESHHVLLESGRGGKYSIIGMSPWAVLEGKNLELTIRTKVGTEVKNGPLLQSLREWLQENSVEKNDKLPDFQGGIIGQFSYDIVREIEEIPHMAEDDLETADLQFFAFDEVVVIEHESDMIWFISVVEKGNEALGIENLHVLEKKWSEVDLQGEGWHHTYEEKTESVHRSFDEDHFMAAVKKTQEYIAAGDVFQVNLSVREERELKTHPLHIYECLRRINPSPYMGYFHTPELQYVGGSPELLVKVNGDEVSTRPIAGTRSRGKTEEEDQQLANTLIENEKERAEHVMLVDLERNDLGRVCEYGTVHVDELMVIEKYSHVMHIVSNVIGKKAKNADTTDVIKATFPGGTITGAPKIRTMEIIEELEPVRRGIYTGSLGWIGYNGDMELNITIRTMIVKDGQVFVQAGAGIVIDSNPKAEYKESLKKAAALWKAKELSEEEMKETSLVRAEEE